MKKLIFCFDGTWNELDSPYPTNVARIAQSVSQYDKDGNLQIIHYDEGVGTTATEKISGGVFGKGLTENMVEAYHFLVLNYRPGDKIYLFGFSRGAFTARSFAGLIRNCGIVSRRSLQRIRDAVDLYLERTKSSSPGAERARKFRLQHCPKLCLPGDIRWRDVAQPNWREQYEVESPTNLEVEYLGVWDTVGALGVPQTLGFADWFNKKYSFHDVKLSKFVKSARHAVAVDEMRGTFTPALWSNIDNLNGSHGDENLPYDEQPYQQMLFPGTHGAVGGGGPIRALSDFSLEWIYFGAKERGLAFDTDVESPLFSLNPNQKGSLFNEMDKNDWDIKDKLIGLGLNHRNFETINQQHLHQSVALRYHCHASQLPERKEYRPPHWKNYLMRSTRYDLNMTCRYPMN